MAQDIRTLVIEAMNEVYFGKKGRTSTIAGANQEEMKPIARTYFLSLLDGQYEFAATHYDPAKAPETVEKIVNLALCAYLDFTEGGHNFVVEEHDKEVALKLIPKVEQTTYTSCGTAYRVFLVLLSCYLDRIPEFKNNEELFQTNCNTPDFIKYINEVLKLKVLAKARELWK